MNTRKTSIAFVALLIIGTVVGLYFSFFNSTIIPRDTALANNSVSFGDGNVSIEKKYSYFGSELDRLEVSPNSAVTVRLRFNNTSSSTANNVSITDTIPAGFTYIPGSTRLQYVDADTVAVSDSVWTGDQLTVAPEVGIHSNTNAIASSDLSFGRKKYLQYYTCYYSNGVDDSFYDSYLLAASNDQLTGVTCRPLVGYTSTLAGPNDTGVNNINITGKSFANMYTCLYTNSASGDNATNYYLHTANNTGTNSNSCPFKVGYNQAIPTNPINGVNQAGSGGYAIELRSRRYINMFACSYDSNNNNDTFKDYFVLNSSNTAETSQTCRTFTEYTSTASDPLTQINAVGTGGYAIDILDTTRGYGYIEYQMTAPATEGIHGTNVQMAGSFGSTLEYDGELSISTSTLACDYITPANGERTIDLQDAELRTDQDFTCNYNVEICVELFMDLDEDGIFNNADYRIGGQDVEIRRNNELAAFSSIQNNNTGQDCFTPLRNGIQYSINIPTPPTPISTTGGNTQTQDIFFDSGSTTLRFGYSSGDLTLTVDETIDFGSFATSDTVTESCGTVQNVTVSDTRLSVPGYSVTATVSNFDYQNITASIPIAQALTSTPGSIRVDSGNAQEAPTIGIAKTAASTSDPLPIMSAGTGLGEGTFSADVEFCLDIPAYSLAGDLESIITFTAV